MPFMFCIFFFFVCSGVFVTYVLWFSSMRMNGWNKTEKSAVQLQKRTLDDTLEKSSNIVVNVDVNK